MTTKEKPPGAYSSEVIHFKIELSSLAIDCKRRNEFNDRDELESLATAIKEVYFQDYKTAYDISNIENDQSNFNHLI
jgi:hypothetical protein